MVTADGVLEALLDFLLPDGGQVFMTINAYFDESGTHAGERFLCVGGYLFEKEKANELDREWARMLADFRIPFFHMVEIQACSKRYCHLGRDLREALVKRAASIVKNTFLYGIVVSTEPEAYERVMPKHPLILGPYTHCARGCFHAVKDWADRREYEGKIAYFFESGHEHEDETNAIMKKMVKSEEDQKAYRYGGHGFAPKKATRPLQAADMLAWHYTANLKRIHEGDDSRDDFVDLIDINYECWHHDAKGLEPFAEIVRKTDELYPDARKPDPPDEEEK